MNKADQIKAPPIKLFGNYALLQGIRNTSGVIHVPTDKLPGVSTAVKLHIAALGDSEELKRRGLAIGDEVELVQTPREATPANARLYPTSEDPYMLTGGDNILGVRID